MYGYLIEYPLSTDTFCFPPITKEVLACNKPFYHIVIRLRDSGCKDHKDTPITILSLKLIFW